MHDGEASLMPREHIQTQHEGREKGGPDREAGQSPVKFYGHAALAPAALHDVWKGSGMCRCLPGVYLTD